MSVASAAFAGRFSSLVLSLITLGAFALDVKVGGLGKTKSLPTEAKASPTLIPLLRESVPIKKGEKTISSKSSYSGMISMGSPAQDFRVVFDTGSGHVVVPSASCPDDTCLIHRHYNLTKSQTAKAINVDGKPVPEDEYCDQVNIGYGTGKLTGEFANENVCVGESCFEVSIVMAVTMTSQPFKSFAFDGIFGLSLKSLAIAPGFNYLHRMTQQDRKADSKFAFFLTTSEDEQEGLAPELAFGGYNKDRLLTPLKWAPVVQSKMGYWQIQIKEVRIGNITLDICQDGSCRGIVDSGSSHIGIPAPSLQDVMHQLSTDAVDKNMDCRDAEAPPLELVLEGLTLSLTPDSYMRPIPLAAGTKVGSRSNTGNEYEMHSIPSGAGGEAAPMCAPRLMPVNFPKPLGGNLFLLGEPVLHHFYTVYDWENEQVGFGLAANERNRNRLATPGEEASFGDDDDIVISLLQVTLTMHFVASSEVS